MSMADWRINFFDLGMFTGEETAEFLRLTDTLADGRERPIVCVYGIDANRAYADYCKKRFAEDPRVFIFPFAIGSDDGKQSFLYVGATPEASSLYRRKHDVNSGVSVPVQEMRFSSFLRGLGFTDRARDSKTINIIKANIEGAEWDLICDLEANGLFGMFDIFLGTDQWTGDMKKCTDLLTFVSKARSILDRHGIIVEPFCMGTENYPDQPPNVDLLAKIRNIVHLADLKEREALCPVS